jgi:hypothetical protein
MYISTPELVLSLEATTQESNTELELKLMQTQMAQKPMLQTEVNARALRARQCVKRDEVWVCGRCA